MSRIFCPRNRYVHCSAACWRAWARAGESVSRVCLCSWQTFTMRSLFSRECSLRRWTTTHILWEGGGWAPCPGAPRPGHAAGRPAASRGLFSRVGALPPPVFRSESPSCAAFPCGRKTGHKAHLSRLWVTARASSCLQPEGGCGRRPGPQGLAGALQGEAGPGPRCGWAALLWVVFLNTPTYKFN